MNLMVNNEFCLLGRSFNKGNFSKFHTFLTPIFMVFLAVCIGILPFFISKKTPNEIYEDLLLSVVEIKAASDGIGESLGTAEFVDKEGTLVTNAHVVTYTELGEQMAFQNISIRFASDDYFIDVQLVKFDTELDVAVLKMEKSKHKFKPAKIGNSADIETGDKIYAMGNSAGYGLSMAEGIVGMPLININYNNSTRRVIQASVNITDGNSGGALLDENGKLVGITTFRTRDLKGNVIHGISYCIPINAVMEYINK